MTARKSQSIAASATSMSPTCYCDPGIDGQLCRKVEAEREPVTIDAHPPQMKTPLDGASIAAMGGKSHASLLSYQ
jgi:hypothetical protein